MLAIKLAFKNLWGAGLRTWLNAAVLSLAFIIIIFHNGIIDGWNEQARRDTKEWETGSGQLWHPNYDRYDPLSFQDAHGAISPGLQSLIKNNQITPVLISQATIYPGGRAQNILLKGILPEQKIVKIPSASLLKESNEIPAVIGKRMAANAKLRKGDRLLIRWRDKNGTFDALEIKIADIFNSNVPTVDNNQVWLPLNKLQEMTGMQNEATMFVVNDAYKGSDIGSWKFKDLKFLMKDIDETIQTKKVSGAILYLLLLSIALLAIFDTQILSIFRRQKEIGTYIALGMTRSTVIKIFTIEGSAHSIFALALGFIYGFPLLALISKLGIPMPKTVDEMGFTIAEKIFPAYSLGLILSTTLLVVISATIVSYFPTRRISRMKPTDALRGKIQ